MRQSSWLAVLAVLVTNRIALGGAAFMGIGDLPGGVFHSEALGVSPDGTAVVGTSAYADNRGQACRWMNGALIGLPLPPGIEVTMRAQAVSDGGHVIVGRFVESWSDFDQAFAWENGSTTPLGFLGGGAIAESEAHAVTADGALIAGVSTNGVGDHEAFLRPWPAGSMTGLGSGPGGTSCVAQGISKDGTLMAGYATGTDGRNHAARIEANGTITELPDLPGGVNQSLATAISADGSTLVGQGRTGAGFEAARWTSDLQIHSLGAFDAGYSYSVARGVSAHGSAIVGAASGGGQGIAFIWDAAHGFRDLANVLVDDHGLDLTGWTFVSANGISWDGQVIVGSGTNPRGDTEGWIAILDNSPRLSVDATQLAWIQPYAPAGTHWDVVRGNLMTLLASGGDFASSTLDCVVAGTPSTTVAHGLAPEAGQGFWFLVRESGGSFDLTHGNQVDTRDSEIAASAHDCL